jgi:putative endonuclease
MSGWVYIVTNPPNGTLYIGVTDDLARRAWEHRTGLVEGFTKKYGLPGWCLSNITTTCGRRGSASENMKHWRRAWKVRLILDQNPAWDDLYKRLA